MVVVAQPPPTTTTAPSTSPAQCEGPILPVPTHHITWSFNRLLCEYKTDWPNPPQISAIRTVLDPFLDRLDLGHNPLIEFLGDGSYHKVFHVHRRYDHGYDLHLAKDNNSSSHKVHAGGYVFRTALPVHPFYKTASEVATMTYVRQHTDIPVPRVYAYDASSQNAVGHEWFLMDMVDGASTYSQVEESLDTNQKLNIARQLADCVHQLGQLQFSSIGSLYFQDDLRHHVSSARGVANRPLTPSACHAHGHPSRGGGPIFIDPTDNVSICLGPAVSDAFFYDWRNDHEFDRGPYPTVEAFVQGALEMHRQETSDLRQRARSDMFGAVDAAWGDPSDDQAVRQERVSRMRADWIETTKTRLGGFLDPCVDWTEDSPFFVKEGRFNELALEGDDFVFAREDLRANPSSCRLHHWDISDRNILIDNATGTLRAVLDWEQVVPLPPYLCDFYPRALLGRGRDCANDEVLEPFRSDESKVYSKYEEEEFQERRYDYHARLLRDEFRHRLGSLDPTWSDIYEAQRDDFRPGSAQDGESSNSDAGSVCDDSCGNSSNSSSSNSSSSSSSSSTSVSAYSPASVESAGPHDELCSTHGKEGLTPLQRARAAEAAVRATVANLGLPMHHAWRNVYDLYEALGYTE